MTNKTKILIGISNSFCAHFLRGQINFLTENNFEVLILSGEGEEIALLAKEEGAQLITLPFEQSRSFFKDYKTLYRITTIIKQFNPDIINAGNPKSGFLIMLAAKLLNRKNRVFTLHGLVSDTKKGLKRWVISKIEHYSSVWSHHTIVVSKSLRQHAIDRGIIAEKKSFVLHNGSANGIDVNEFKRTDEVLQEAKHIAENIKLNENWFTIGFVGRVSNDKGITYLFDAFKELRKKYKLQIVVIGPLWKNDPLSKEYLDDLYQHPDIFYLGKVLRIIPYYLLLNVLVLPSLREGFGNVLIEAAAMEIPVIASNIPGIRDAVSKNNGVLVQPQNVDQIASNIEKIIIEKELQKRMGIEGRCFVNQHFKNNDLWNAYHAFYQQLTTN